MACYHPLPAFRLADGSVSFVERGDVLGRIELPCGQCVGCRLARAEGWSLRVMHEAQCHPLQTCWFVTLTYSPENLPPGGGLQYRDFQLFMKRLRRSIGKSVRFFMCGEYGEQLSRPHYHACLFGLPLTDLKLFKSTPYGDLFTSEFLSRLWGLGFVSIGSLTKQSAGYVARYSLKKITGDMADGHYTRVDPETGELVRLAPEFARMSLRPGIGSEWFRRFGSDVFPHDMVVHDGRRHRVPRYYDKLHRRADAAGLESIKDDRSIKARSHWEDQTDERLAVREAVQKARIRSLTPRKLST